MALIKISIRNIIFPIVFTIVLFIIFTNSTYLSGEPKITNSLSCYVSQDLNKCKGNKCPTIQECIKQNEDQLKIDIKIMDKIYTKCENIYLEKSLILSISSNDAKDLSTIQCEGEGYEEFSIHSISSTESLTINLENLIFDGEDGITGGIVIDSKHRLKNTLTLNNVKIMGCNSNNNGGGLNVMNFETTVKDSTFENNWAKDTLGGGNGGAIWTNEHLTIHSSTFMANRADNNGGSIFSPNVLITDSHISNGKAKNGGAISAVLVSVQNSEFSDNSATESGGALEITSSNSTSYIYKSKFQSNSAYHGGHLFLLPSSTDILGSEFTDGQAEYGGAIFIQDKHYDGNNFKYDLTDSIFQDNSAKSKGGAFYSIHMKLIIGGLFKNSQSKDSSIQSFPDYFLAHQYTAQVSAWENCSNAPAIKDKNFDSYMCLGVDKNFCENKNLGATCSSPQLKLLDISEKLNIKF